MDGAAGRRGVSVGRSARYLVQDRDRTAAPLFDSVSAIWASPASYPASPVPARAAPWPGGRLRRSCGSRPHSHADRRALPHGAQSGHCSIPPPALALRSLV